MGSIISRALTKHFERAGLMSQCKYGFRKGLGARDLPTPLQHTWGQAVNNQGCVRVLAVDIAGAFDKVSHSGLLFKLRRMGVSGSLHRWLSSYLQGRSIRALISGHTSSARSISAGVPQGSTLGPTLFLAYINDIEQSLPSGLGLGIYADGATLYTVLKTMDPPATSCPLLQQGLDPLAALGKSWRVAFEPTKSQAPTISRKRVSWNVPPITFDGEQNSIYFTMAN